MNISLTAFLLICVIYQYNCETSTYTNKYDGVDLDQILSSERLLNGYVNCLLDKGPCTADGKELKLNLPDAIQDECSKCTDRQREGADKVMQYIIDHRPEDWKKLEDKFKCKDSPACEFDPIYEESVLHLLIECQRFCKQRFEQEMDTKIEKDTLALLLSSKETRDTFLRYNSDGTYKLKYLKTKEPANKSASKEDTSESSYDDDADDEDDENNKDNYKKKDTTK